MNGFSKLQGKREINKKRGVLILYKRKNPNGKNQANKTRTVTTTTKIKRPGGGGGTHL